MLNTFNNLRKSAIIALHAKENRQLEDGLLYNLSCEAFYNDFPRVSAIKETSQDGNVEYKLNYMPGTNPVASIIVREDGVHTGTLLYHYHSKTFSVLDPTVTTGKWCDVHDLYAKIMRLSELDQMGRSEELPCAKVA